MADISNQAVALAINDLEQELVWAGRNYEDAVRSADAYSAAAALRDYNAKQAEYDRLTGRDQPQQQQQLSAAQHQYLNNLRAMGDDVDSPAALQVLGAGHVKAIAAGWAENRPGYFRAIDHYRNTQGDGKSPVLTEHAAAELCGVDHQTYAQNAAKLRWLKQHGYYQE